MRIAQIMTGLFLHNFSEFSADLKKTTNNEYFIRAPEYFFFWTGGGGVSQPVNTRTDHATSVEEFSRIQHATGRREDLLTAMKRRKLKWHGHVS